MAPSIDDVTLKYQSFTYFATGILQQGPLRTRQKEPTMQHVPPGREEQVTFANYRTHPFSTWAFRNMGAPTNVLMIPRAGSVHPLVDDGQSALAQLQVDGRPLQEILETSHTNGFLVLKGDRLLYERYYNGLSAHFQHIWFSATKSLTGSALGLLAGEIDLQASPSRYLRELKGSGFERVTIQNVLDHASAIDFKEDYLDPEANFSKYYGPASNMAFLPGARDAQPGSTDIYGVHDFLGKFVKPDPQRSPDQNFDYNSANADVIGWLLARVSGQPFEQFIHQHIWSKLGCEHDAYVCADRAYMAVTTGGMNSTLRDLARFGSMILQQGCYNGHQVLPAAWVDATLNITVKDRQKMRAKTKYQNEVWSAYHNMWWILDAEAGEYCGVGIHGQALYLNRRREVVIAFFSSQPVASNTKSPFFTAKLRAARRIAEEV